MTSSRSLSVCVRIDCAATWSVEALFQQPMRTLTRGGRYSRTGRTVAAAPRRGRATGRMPLSDSEIPPLHCHACGAAMPGARAFAAIDRLHGTHGEFAVAICPACGSGVTTPVVGGDELGAYYPSGYGPYEDPANPLVRLISRVIRHRQSRRALATFPVAALRAAGPGRGIDIGCGRGDLAAALIGVGLADDRHRALARGRRQRPGPRRGRPGGNPRRLPA